MFQSFQMLIPGAQYPGPMDRGDCGPTAEQGGQEGMEMDDVVVLRDPIAHPQLLFVNTIICLGRNQPVTDCLGIRRLTYLLGDTEG